MQIKDEQRKRKVTRRPKHLEKKLDHMSILFVSVKKIREFLYLHTYTLLEDQN
jgi:hypothetical protein